MWGPAPGTVTILRLVSSPPTVLCLAFLFLFLLVSLTISAFGWPLPAFLICTYLHVERTRMMCEEILPLLRITPFQIRKLLSWSGVAPSAWVKTHLQASLSRKSCGPQRVRLLLHDPVLLQDPLTWRPREKPVAQRKSLD